MPVHPAIVVNGLKQLLQIRDVPTVAPEPGQVRVRVEWVPSAPLDVWQVDAGLMASFPQGLGDSVAGTVVEVGSDVKRLRVGQKVFGFVFHGEQQKAMQVYITAPEHLLGKVPEGISLPAAATLPNNFCTAFYTLSDKLGIDLPFPRPDDYKTEQQNRPILIWGGSSSVGQYAIQILAHWGYTNVIATASSRHHDMVKSLGASHVVDYRDPEVTESIRKLVQNSKSLETLRVFDCVDLKEGSLRPISKIATQAGSVVAALLPVVVDSPAASNIDDGATRIATDAAEEADWATGVEVISVATYFYESNKDLKNTLQPDIMTTLLAEGSIRPNKQRIIEGETLLERAQKAIDLMRTGTVSAERLVWQVWNPEEFSEYA